MHNVVKILNFKVQEKSISDSIFIQFNARCAKKTWWTGFLKTSLIPNLQVAPPRSYINIENFSNLTQLSNYLVYLVENPEIYREYFWWRDHYQLVSTKEVQFEAFCNLCQVLHEKNSQGNDLATYSDFRNYWNPTGVCRHRPPLDNKFLQ